MHWNQALACGTVVIPASCRLIIVGETKEGLPFCYEDSFTLSKADGEQMTVTLETMAIHPLEKLHHVYFIEFSFFKRGILYYALVDLLHLETKRCLCTLTLTTPPQLLKAEQRQYKRIVPQVRTPLTCRIIGVRGQRTHQGNAFFTGQILDLSAGGVSFMTSTRLFSPLELELSFVLPGLAQKLTLHAEVIRIAPFGSDAYRVAVRFNQMPESTAIWIEEYCSASDG
ncbi:PilZ domain-containing protein [Paenibacillus naphthalenovorans]|uniref:PilZ domain-containing protein n=1 Tax=Paenibacillus naphthalenovorans TaxID=162209 RepID=UPI00088E6EFA|nr:PilZ domain-containing protein [Paenibacillus naphthalenovorans]SDI68552.1 PilZ domain-containing protein [Paenibacillus naphthalenovorans]